MKKNKGLIIFLSIVLFSLAIYVGLAIITYQNDLNVLISILLQILGIVIILPIFVAVHELGHMVFGVMSGYSLLSFKLGPFEWYRKENKISFKINPPSNIILGQCLMLPPKPKKKKQPKFFLYNAGGLIFSNLFNVVVICLFVILYRTYFAFVLIPVIAISLFLTINNSVYQKGGINDVCNHVTVKNNPNYINSILYQLEMIGNVTSGKRYGAKTFYEPYFENKLNHITIPVAQFRFLQAIDKSDFTEAKRIANVMKRNYNSIPIAIQRTLIIFPILFSDIVIDKNMDAFRRHFRWIRKQEKALCLKYDSDLKYNYLIYEKINKEHYNIKDIVNEMLQSEVLLDGERLSLKKMYQFLLDELDARFLEDKSFENEEYVFYENI